jgi:hypothetical protein
VDTVYGRDSTAAPKHRKSFGGSVADRKTVQHNQKNTNRRENVTDD